MRIADSNGDWQEFRQCGGRNSKNCEFHFSVLSNAPFNLTPGTKIRAEVRICSQGKCSGWVELYHETGKDVVLVTSPPDIGDVPGILTRPVLEWLNRDDGPLTFV